MSDDGPARTTLVVPAALCCSDEWCRALRKTLAAHPGPMPVAIRLTTAGGSRTLGLSYRTSPAGVERLARLSRVVVEPSAPRRR